MQKLNEDLLYSASEKILLEIKAEGTENLKSYHDSETIITNKATSLLQILFPVFVGIFGFIIVELSSPKSSVLLWFSCLEEIIIFLSCYFLFETLHLKKVALGGSKPSNILNDDIVVNSDDENVLQYLRVKVYSLQNAISACEISYFERKNYIQKSLNILMIGTSLVIIIFLLYHFGQGFFPRK